MRRLLVLCLLTLAATPALAHADTVSLVNRGQPGLDSNPAQAPLTLTAHGTCSERYTTEEANGGPSPCPAGSWPEQGNGDWGPSADVAGGDTLALTFSGPVSALKATEMTEYPVGLETPPCASAPGGGPACGPQKVSNFEPDALTPAATDDPAVWTISVPTRTNLTRFGVYVALSATTAGGGQNFTFTARGPRWADESHHCGRSYVNTGQTENTCPDSAVAPGLPPTTGPGATGTPTQTPAATAAVKLQGKPALTTNGRLNIRLSCTGTTTAKISLRRLGRTLFTTSMPLTPGTRALRLALPKALRKTIAAHRKRTYELRVTAGQATTRTSLKY